MYPPVYSTADLRTVALKPRSSAVISSIRRINIRIFSLYTTFCSYRFENNGESILPRNGPFSPRRANNFSSYSASICAIVMGVYVVSIIYIKRTSRKKVYRIITLTRYDVDIFCWNSMEYIFSILH